MKAYDISLPLSDATVPWPGVTTPWAHREVFMDMDRGDLVNNSTWCLNSHAGTHLDMPSHDLAGGGDAASAPLAPYVGPCIVVEIGETDGQIRRADLEAVPGLRDHCRVLFRTENSRDDLWARSDFVTDYVSLHEDGAAYLVDLGYILAGIDYQGIERFDSSGRETHRTLLGGGCMILEGADLRAVPAGEFILVCLPLRLVDGEASPVRAVLVEGSQHGLNASDWQFDR